MCQLQRLEDVGFIISANQIERDFADRARLADAGIVPEDIDVECLDECHIVGIVQVEFLDTDIVEAKFGDLVAQRRHLRADLGCRNDGVAGLGHADCGAFAEARTCAGDENGLGHDGSFHGWMRLMI